MNGRSDCEQSLIFLCKVTARETQARERRSREMRWRCLRNDINYRIRHNVSDNQLECLVIKITRRHSRLFLVSAWYRPPLSSSQDIFSRFEILVDKNDPENNDFYLLGGVNCDMLHNRSNYHTSSNLTNIFDIYGLSQMISEPTRITSTSRTLIDLCITNPPEKKTLPLVSFILGLAITHWFL